MGNGKQRPITDDYTPVVGGGFSAIFSSPPTDGDDLPSTLEYSIDDDDSDQKQVPTHRAWGRKSQVVIKTVGSAFIRIFDRDIPILMTTDNLALSPALSFVCIGESSFNVNSTRELIFYNPSAGLLAASYQDYLEQIDDQPLDLSSLQAIANSIMQFVIDTNQTPANPTSFAKFCRQHGSQVSFTTKDGTATKNMVNLEIFSHYGIGYCRQKAFRCADLLSRFIRHHNNEWKVYRYRGHIRIPGDINYYSHAMVVLKNTSCALLIDLDYRGGTIFNLSNISDVDAQRYDMNELRELYGPFTPPVNAHAQSQHYTTNTDYDDTAAASTCPY